MAGVVRLTDKLSQITMGEGTGCDLFSSLKEFFSLQTVQDKMLSLNKDRLDAEGTNRLGASMPSYSNSWKNRKQRQGLGTIDHGCYTYHYTGATFDALTVTPMEDSVSIIPKDAPSYEAYLDRKAWGLTDTDFEEIAPEMKNHVINSIKDFLNG